MNNYLNISDLTICYQKKSVLKNLNLQLQPKEIVGLVAPNGSGKTTLLKAIAHLVPIKEGEVSVQSTSYTQRKKYLRTIFFIESSAHLYPNISVLDHLNFIKNLWKSKKDINKVIEYLNMKSYQTQPVQRLSLEMKQHLLIGMYLVSDAPILLLDEPMNGLDPTSLEVVNRCFKKLREEEKCILFSSHNLFNVKQLCDRVLFLKDQQIKELPTTVNLEKAYKECFNHENDAATHLL